MWDLHQSPSFNIVKKETSICYCDDKSAFFKIGVLNAKYSLVDYIFWKFKCNEEL